MTGDKSMLLVLSEGAALLQQARDALRGDRPPLTSGEHDDISRHLSEVADFEQGTDEV